RREAVLARMLAANLFPPVLDTVLSLDADGLACLGCPITLRDLESVTLAQVVQEFVGQAIDWQAVLAQAPAAVETLAGFPSNRA
ncbi:MAG TPA: CesT family type III secretion system chaperone, partial [Ramlibacter sp.]|nr:CesT family type III secretion system chaperone [Ramlibacter sp.]